MVRRRASQLYETALSSLQVDFGSSDDVCVLSPAWPSKFCAGVAGLAAPVAASRGQHQQLVVSGTAREAP